MKGLSTGFIPAQVKMIAADKNMIVKTWWALLGADFVLGSDIRIKIDITSAMTPPILLGIERRMAYVKSKYHSGWMCVGVNIGLAMIEFSGSPIL